ncbi:tyrosine kinase family protein [Medicago truncatula]|uniref:non-specific serine/threonine protein kinase n=1 Tax=Medicago truncatula TaxID=3880 RepID=G7JMK5_MEDTR|nr:tyrosine kinase family protein [Medicago truncatula]
MDSIPTCIDFVTIIWNKDGCTNSYTEFLPWLPHKKINNNNNNNNVKHKNDVSIVLLILTIVISPFSFLMCFKLCHNSTNKKAYTTATKNENLFDIWNYDVKITYDDVIKTQLSCGKFATLKKLHNYEADVSSFDANFRIEVRILSKIKQINIVKLYGFCLHKRIMFLIYQYMKKESLFSVLYEDLEAVEFNCRKRLN